MSEYGAVAGERWGEVWIVGGGPSARSQVHALAGKRVLAVNDAWLRLMAMGLPCCLFTLDNNWVRANRSSIQTAATEKYIALPLETWPDCGGIPGVTYLRWGHGDGLSDDPGMIHTGCNSGYGAINLAYLKGATDIHLLGYDMDPADKDDYRFWAPLFRGMPPQLAAGGVRVVNHNPASFIDAFPKEALS